MQNEKNPQPWTIKLFHTEIGPKNSSAVLPEDFGDIMLPSRAIGNVIFSTYEVVITSL